MQGENQLAGATAVGRYFGRGRTWGWRFLREWLKEQEAGGPTRVLTRGRTLYTTFATLRHHAPKREDEALGRQLRRIERDLDHAFARIAELERRLGRRR